MKEINKHYYATTSIHKIEMSQLTTTRKNTFNERSTYYSMNLLFMCVTRIKSSKLRISSVAIIPASVPANETKKSFLLRLYTYVCRYFDVRHSFSTHTGEDIKMSYRLRFNNNNNSNIVWTSHLVASHRFNLRRWLISYMYVNFRKQKIPSGDHHDVITIIIDLFLFCIGCLVTYISHEPNTHYCSHVNEIVLPIKVANLSHRRRERERETEKNSPQFVGKGR